MMRLLWTRLVFLAALLLTPWVVAGDDHGRIDMALQAINPELSADAVRETPIEGLYEVVVGDRVVYMSADGRYLIQGEFIDLKTERSISEGHFREVRRREIEAVPVREMVVFPAEGERRGWVTVFTDIECPFCQRLHLHVPEINEQGVEVRYIMMPRSIPSSSYRKSVAVYCADDRAAAMDEAKAGTLPEANEECPNPIQQHVQLARDLGIRATPTLITHSGRIHEGYLGTEGVLGLLEADD